MKQCPQHPPAVHGVEGKQIVAQKQQVDQRKARIPVEKHGGAQRVDGRPGCRSEELFLIAERLCMNDCAGEVKTDFMYLRAHTAQREQMSGLVERHGKQKGEKGLRRIEVKIGAQQGDKGRADLKISADPELLHGIPPLRQSDRRLRKVGRSRRKPPEKCGFPHR